MERWTNNDLVKYTKTDKANWLIKIDIAKTENDEIESLGYDNMIYSVVNQSLSD